MAEPVLTIEPAPARRGWMDGTVNRFAYRCLPMVLANQHGWLLRTRHEVSATWDGSDRPAATIVRTSHAPETGWVTSHFGGGILTWTIPLLFRTPPGIELLLRGPSNWPIDGASALEGLVETDWSPATATMNWQLTRPGHEVVFEAGAAVAMVVPVCRDLIETCVPTIDRTPEARLAYEDWRVDRQHFLDTLDDRSKGPDSWQRDYQRGRIGDGCAPIRPHRSRLHVADFRST